MGIWNHQDLAGRPRPPLGASVVNNLGAAYPTMIVEVGHFQSLLDLNQKVTFYEQPSKFQTPLIPVQVISFGTASPHGSTVNYITTTIGVSPNNIIGIGRTDPTTGNNYPALR
ncbi:hypothetical protein C1645_816357 [Glomus cerebriforme]|uniref:Uncharacterized protein n=1 Tax=Glomus cerebriforme TaxID=658196 RepID=A0A397TKX4_9GLOM|nr:hypothetical protein C1645_816357 [Glomus cerebriforme]